MKFKVIRKFFIDFEAEEAWLNQMAAKGLHLAQYSFPSYFFEQGDPGKYTYRLELLQHMPSHPESQAYIEFLEDSGVECVATHIRWAFFRKQSSDGPFELYTDNPQKIAHYQRLLALFSVIGGMNLIIGLSNLLNPENPGRWVGLVNIGIAAFAGYFGVRYLLRILRLQKQRQITE